jgi:hypothetical protein
MLIASAMILAPEVMAVPTVGEVDSFDAWAAEQGKAYTVEEEASRRAIFEENSKMIDAHNEAAAAGEFTFTMGIGPFADLTSEEYMARVLTPFERTEPRDETFLTEVEADVSAVNFTHPNYHRTVRTLSVTRAPYPPQSLGNIHGLTHGYM